MRDSSAPGKDRQPSGPREQRPGRFARVQAASAVRARQTPEQSLLWTVTIALFAAGAVMVYSASSASSALSTHGDPLGYLKRYLVLGAVGMLAMRYTSRINLDQLRKLTPLLVGISFGLLLIVLVPGIGVEVNGARRWIGPGIARFQPSELMKFALVLYVAMLVAKDPTRVRNLKSMSNPLFYVVGAAVVLISMQPDLGTDLVICATIGMILVAAGAQMKDLGKVVAVLALLVLVFSLIEPYRAARLTAFLHPGSDPTGASFQSEQARIAIGSGGLVGRGLGESVQKVFYLPEAHTDMILAVVGEELGLLGIVGLAALYFALIMTGLRAARNSRDAYARLIAIGVSSLIACQALLNFFAVLGMAPLTGVPLPFISYGASNLIVMLAAMGLLVNVASGRHSARVRVLPGGADPHRRPTREPSAVAAAGGEYDDVKDWFGGFGSASRSKGANVRARGHYEDRNRGRGHGGSRRSRPGSR